jgi:hypothetical protein
MPLDAAFSPYRFAPGAPAAGGESDAPAGPALGSPGVVPAALVPRTFALVEAGLAAPGVPPCLAADGQPVGMGGAARACPSSRAQRAAAAHAVRDARAAGFAGVVLDRTDLPHTGGFLGAGFCPECQRDFVRHLAREYGDHFQAIDYLRLARTAVAEAPGAVTFEQLPFGRDFWRWRHEALEGAIAADVRAARDAARGEGEPAAELPRPFEVVLHFDAVGPTQLRSARLADGVVFPALVPAAGTGIGLARLARAVMGHRAAAIAPPPGTPGPSLARLAAVAATCGVGLAEPVPGAPPEVAGIRRLSRQLGLAGRAPSQSEPFAEVVLLYSAEADLWTGGRHLQALLRAAELLAAAHVQAPVVTRLPEASREAPVVLADAAALPPADVKELRRRLEAGGSVLSFGAAGEVDETGHAHEGALPSGKPTGVRVGQGTLVELPPLAPLGAGETLPAELVEKGLAALLGRGRRAAGVSGRQPVLVVADRTPAAAHVHLVSLGSGRAQGVTLFLGVKLAGGARRGRFVSADGTDVRIPMNPSGTSLSTVLPSWQGYAVLSLAP